ncbi:MAG: hypothetical protein QOJ43_407 [Gaiellaceae bacterium]|nr:hypothetical protein [Gaiellaceae bacterium]
MARPHTHLIRSGAVVLALVVLAFLPLGTLGDGVGEEVAVADTSGQRFFVGFSDDTVKYDASVADLARGLGAPAFRVTLMWTRGQRDLAADDARSLERAVGTGVRVVLAVYAHSADEAPQTPDTRDDYCAYVRGTLERFPAIRDVVIWNEPNKSHFWRPQFAPDGASAAPAAYGELLARCWDVLHASRPDVNVIAPATAPRGNDRPDAASNVSHSPGNFIRKLGQAYRASGRKAPLFDTVGHHVYGETAAERPWKQHPLSGTIGIGDWRELMQALWDGFDGTEQPIPGECRAGRCTKIWYLEGGYQTTIEPARSGSYRGAENEPYPIPDFGGGEAGRSYDADSPAPDQATQLVDAIQRASCQPHVEAFFNFLLADEADLAGWQSGVLWADRALKQSYPVFRDVAADAAAARVDCSALKGSPQPAAFTPQTSVRILKLAWPTARRFATANASWRFGVSAAEHATYRAVLYRVGGSTGRVAAERQEGRLARGVYTTVRFPARRLPPAVYQMELQLLSEGSDERFAIRTSPTFAVGKAGLRGRPAPARRPSMVGVNQASVQLSPILELPPSTGQPQGIQLDAPPLVEDEGVRLLDVKVTDPEVIEKVVVAEINRVRQARGLGMLRISPELGRAGDAHGRVLAYAGEFTHDWPADDATFGRWILRFYPARSFRTWSAGENLFWTSGTFTARQAVTAWLASPPHRKVMLTPSWREIGLGIVRAEDASGVYQGYTVSIAAAEFGLRK